MDTNTPFRPEVEHHPFEPFLPADARVLFLGSFPPQPKRWSMEFYYPNYTNDFWYMIGLLWFGDRYHFALRDEKRFDCKAVTDFCRRTGIALYDTAVAVRRLKDNASDKFLEVVTPTDLGALLGRIPHCRTVVTTGQKATETLCAEWGCEPPAIGSSVRVGVPVCDPEGGMGIRPCDFWRMPSTSRAYPLALDRKAAAYAQMFRRIGLLE